MKNNFYLIFFKLVNASINNFCFFLPSQVNNTNKAIEHYLKALRIKPDYEEAHNNLGISLYLKSNTEKALVHFRKALSINPNNVPAKNNLKKALMQQEKL